MIKEEQEVSELEGIYKGLETCWRFKPHMWDSETLGKWLVFFPKCSNKPLEGFEHVNGIDKFIILNDHSDVL